MAGFKTTLALLKADLEFERAALRTYMEFASSSNDKEIKAMFLSLVRAEQGHATGLLKLITDMEHGAYPVVFYCPVCGWEIDFGNKPEAGKQVRCRMCGVVLTLEEADGDYKPVIPGR